MYNISYREYNLLGSYLYKYHEIFYKFWQVGKPIFVDDIPTCCIQFDEEGDFIKFLFNRKLWDILTNYERTFCIAHECLHIILNHGVRSVENYSPAVNIAMDVVINELLIEDLKLLPPENIPELVRLKIFKEKGIDAKKRQNFEYYYNLLINNIDKFKDIKFINHSYLSSQLTNKILSKVFNTTDKQTENIKQKINNQAGNANLDKIYEICQEEKYRIGNWQTLLSKIVLSRKRALKDELDKLDWTKEKRRYSLIEKDVIVPNNKKKELKDKIDIWFFSDISGSCIHLRDKFIGTARSIPQDMFNVKFHTFDTKCKEIDINATQVEGGGGTSFACIEDYIKKSTIDKGLKYPEVIVCISDGESSNKVEPYKARNWFWLLTQNHKSCFPKESFSLVLDNI